eukprot:CAMPEP_0196806942 /NCGR_PEP_ID=MMETSP1362-20130617/6869_1 /TAXON_ID=163516 /ORGANISM="Leptocylindrus danicus, Strain CCMP1856" /LENGTH=721 /DNA_ID=CAMNT_0042180641 /DNA_START=145 /DNA_END=2310 /DNA_ORIENTATION=+
MLIAPITKVQANELSAVTQSGPIPNERGVMFDVDTLGNDIFITQINHLFNRQDGINNSISLYNVRVYYKEGTHQMFENDASAWTEVVDIGLPISSLGDDDQTQTTPIYLSNQSLKLTANARHALYITVVNPGLAEGSKYRLVTDIDPSNPFEVNAENDDLILYTGSRLTGVFDGDLYKATAWIGSIHYFFAAPTASPSESLTPPPSKSPTQLPSSSPTQLPSSSPTQLPSSLPTNSPTKPPTQSPSYRPSQIPSDSPTSIPSDLPSKQPSAVPTFSPSTFPTKLTSGIPSTLPSNSPSFVPSILPSNSPSNLPSSSPSDLPSHSPTILPSNAPIRVASNAPSMQPSPVHLHYTDRPTFQPLSAPSMAPSVSNAPSSSADYFSYLSMKPSTGFVMNNPTNVPSDVPMDVVIVPPIAAAPSSSSSSSPSPTNVNNATIPKTITEENTDDDGSSSSTVLIASLCTVSTVLLSALIVMFYRRKKQKHKSNSSIAQNRAYYSNAKQFFDAQNKLAAAAAAANGGDAALVTVNDLRVYDDASSAHMSGVYGGDSHSSVTSEVDVEDRLGVQSQRSQISSEADSLNRPTVRSLDYFGDSSDHRNDDPGNHGNHTHAYAFGGSRSTGSPDARNTDDALLFLNQSQDSEKTLRTRTATNDNCTAAGSPSPAVRNVQSLLLVSPLGMGSPNNNNAVAAYHHVAEERGDVDYPTDESILRVDLSSASSEDVS